jgi:hypothetical protein
VTPDLDYRRSQIRNAVGTYARDAERFATRATALRTEAEDEPAGVATITRAWAALYEEHAAHLGRMARELAAVARGTETPAGERSAAR